MVKVLATTQSINNTIKSTTLNVESTDFLQKQMKPLVNDFVRRRVLPLCQEGLSYETITNIKVQETKKSQTITIKWIQTSILE